MSEERKAALKELEHPDPLQQILALCWLMKCHNDMVREWIGYNLRWNTRA